MELWEKVLSNFSDLKPTDDLKNLGIHLVDESDGTGTYIAKWDYKEPMPEELKEYYRGGN